jgi:hypothetical protein
MELDMDNGAYAKYRQENPTENILLSTYEHVTMFPEELTNEEIVLLVVLPLLALFAIVRLYINHSSKKNK